MPEFNVWMSSVCYPKSNNTIVVLGTYNPPIFLDKQLNSILSQADAEINIYISDDCSDQSSNLENLKKKINSPKISWNRNQENLGFARNFLRSLKELEPEYKFYVFSDQDDIWYEDKVSRAINVLKKIPDDEPALYCSRTAIANENCDSIIGYSTLFNKKPSFQNALVQSIGGGNTMVFNLAARNLIVQSFENLGNREIVSHDWWCYQIVSGANGAVHYDPEPRIMYRQHGNNLVGFNNGWFACLIRVKGVLLGKFKRWNDLNCDALQINRTLLTDANQKILDDFISARKSSLFKRLYFFIRSGIYRQTVLGNIGLMVSAIINKV